MSKARRPLWFHSRPTIGSAAVVALSAALALTACDDFKRHAPAAAPGLASAELRPALAAPPMTPEALPEHFVAEPQVCGDGLVAAAAQNAQTIGTLVWAPFRRPEIGWDVYEPMIAEEIGTSCDGGSPGFAADLAHWQGAHGLRADGVVSEVTFGVMTQFWEARRPFVTANLHGCPPPPPEASLATLPADISYGGKVMRLRPGALNAFERMRATALAEMPGLSANGQLMRVYSAYRSPEEDAARCDRDGNCQGIVRTTCSAHRTGLAVDINLGAAPGFGPDSSDDANRLYMSRAPAYRWMIRRAHHFGFVNYPFEPWHWEWTGEAP